MKTNKEGFIDIFSILFLVVMLVLACVGMRMYNEWKDTNKSQVLNIWNDIKEKDFQKYIDNIEGLPDVSNRVPEVARELQDFLKSQDDNISKEFQTPETLVLTGIMEKCLKNGEVSPECRRIIDQYTDMVVPNGREW